MIEIKYYIRNQPFQASWNPNDLCLNLRKILSNKNSETSYGPYETHLRGKKENTEQLLELNFIE